MVRTVYILLLIKIDRMKNVTDPFITLPKSKFFLFWKFAKNVQRQKCTKTKMYKDNKKWQTKARYENSTLCFKSGKPASLKLSLTVTYFANFFSKICFVNFYNIQKISSGINLQILRIWWHCFKSFIVISWSTWIFKLTSKYWPSINYLFWKGHCEKMCDCLI